MSGTLGRPDWASVLTDLDRRLGILERRLQPRVPTTVPDPVRRFGTVGINMAVFSVYETIELVPGVMACIAAGPTEPYPGQVRPHIEAPLYTSGSLTFQAWLTVWTPDVSQRIRARYDDVSLTSGQIWEPSAETVTTDQNVGSDFSIDSHSWVTMSTSDTVAAHLYVHFTAVPDPV